MKKLYVVRHAKSSWKYPNLSDIERPLNGRGKRNAPAMADFLVERVPVSPGAWIASPSRRTFDTAKEFVKVYNRPIDNVELTQDLYHASASAIRSVVSRVSDQCNSAIIFGHNPGITDFVNELCQQDIYNIPTCGLAGISLDIESWRGINACAGVLDFYQYPKGL